MLANLHAEIGTRAPTPLNFRFTYPTTVDILVQNLHQSNKVIVDAKARPKITFFTINKNSNHWLLLVVDNRPRHRHIYFFDPLGHPCPDNLINAIFPAFPGLLFTDTNLKMHMKVFNAGFGQAGLPIQS